MKNSKFEVVLETTINGEKVSNSKSFDTKEEAEAHAKNVKDGSDIMGLSDDVVYVKES